MVKSFTVIAILFFAIRPMAHGDVKLEDELQIKYPLNENTHYYRNWDGYFSKLLALAMDYSGIRYQLTAVQRQNLPPARILQMVDEGVYDVHWMPTDIKRETQLLPIRIPLYKGLLGWRIMLVHKDNAELFSAIDNVNQLKHLVAGQGPDWPDTKVLANNRFTMANSIMIPTLFEMLINKRIDYFPRSILEAYKEVEELDNDNIVVDHNIVLRYPMAVYFFVRNDDKYLHDILYQGLISAIESGEFDALFNQYFASMITQANLPNRKMFSIPNIGLSSQPHSKDQRLWFELP